MLPNTLDTTVHYGEEADGTPGTFVATSRRNDYATLVLSMCSWLVKTKVKEDVAGVINRR